MRLPATAHKGSTGTDSNSTRPVRIYEAFTYFSLVALFVPYQTGQVTLGSGDFVFRTPPPIIVNVLRNTLGIPHAPLISHMLPE
jgi:hypothetical protein